MPDGLAALDDILAALAGVSLDPIYGCPDCADGGAAYVNVTRAGAESHHEYEYYEPPGVLVDLDEFVSGAMLNLRTCTSTWYMAVAEECDPGT